MIVVTRSDEYLKHHGILGMKWGKEERSSISYRCFRSFSIREESWLEKES